MKSRLIMIAAVIAALVLIAGFAISWFGLFGGNSNGKLMLYGNVDIREVNLGFRVGGRIASINVEEGDKVKPGQRLAALDQAPVDARVAEADAAVAAAQAKLALLRNGSRAQDIMQAKAGVTAAEASYRKAQQDADRREGLVDPGAISKGTWQATLAQLDTSKAQLDEAQQNYSKLKQGARPEEIAAAQAQLESAEAARRAIGVDRSDSVLTAPSDGTIVTRAEEPGAIVAPGATVLTLSIDRPLRVRAYIAETDLSRIAPGMKVTVIADGNAKTYHGTIGFISPQAEFTPKTVQTKDLRTDLVYRLRVIVSDPDDALRQGQPVTVAVTAWSE